MARKSEREKEEKQKERGRVEESGSVARFLGV
jgi:hypothetical protein